MRLYCSPHPESTLYDPAYHATSLRVMHRGVNVHSEKEYDRGEKKKHSGCRRGNSSNNINFLTKSGRTPKSTAAPTKIGSAVMKTGSNLQSTSMPATPNTNVLSVTCVDSALLCKLCIEKSHGEAQCLFQDTYGNSSPPKPEKLEEPATKIAESQNRTGGSDTSRQGQRVEDCKECPHINQTCRAHYLIPSPPASERSTKTRGRRDRTVYAEAYNRPQRVLFAFKHWASLQATGSGKSRLYPSANNTRNIEKITSSAVIQIFSLSAKT